ncbi:hypothetical protein ABPG77_007915 [Micractinium sp. CCAP 211/92]
MAADCLTGLDSSLESGLEDLLDEASLSLQARLALASLSGSGTPAALRSRQPLPVAGSSSRAVQQPAPASLPAQLVLQHAAGIDSLPQQHGLSAANGEQYTHLMQYTYPGSEQQAASPAAVERRLERLRRAAGELVLTPSPRSAAAAAEEPSGATSGFSALLQGELEQLKEGPPWVGNACNIIGDVFGGRSAAARLAALLGPLAEQGQAAAQQVQGCASR